MSKSKKQGRDITPYWTERGFRADIANSKPSPNEDPQGEEAYQRAFLVAAQSNPPRLPNPTCYSNSPSACEYLRKRSIEFFSADSRGEKRPGQDPPEPARRRQRDPDRSAGDDLAQISASTSPSSNYSASTMLPPPSFQSMPRTGQATNTRLVSAQQLPRPQPGSRLATMEPSSWAPSGPATTFDELKKR